MRQEIEKYELIEQYLNDDLSKEQRFEVEQRIKTDPEFAQEVKQQQQVVQLIEEGTFLSIRDKIQAIHQNNNFSGKGKSGRNGKLLLGSGIIIVLSTILVTLFINRNNTEKIDIGKPQEDIVIDSTRTDTIRQEIQVATLEVISEEKIREKEIDEKSKEPVNNSSEINKAENSQVQNDNQNKKIPDTAKKQINEPIPSKEHKIGIDTADVPHEELEIQKVIDCDEVIIFAKVTTSASCEEKPTGKIYIDPESFEGGEGPYSISIDNEVNFRNSYLFDNLFASIYNITIKDKNGCTSDLGVFKISSEPCTYEYAFAPEEGESWTIPNKNKPGKLKIFDKSGRLVYQLSIDFQGTYKWYGKSGAGDQLPMGLYQFTLELEDSEPMVGHVTIIR